MLKSLALAVLALPLLAAPALADAERLSSADFQRANRCLAYANLQALANHPIDLGDLNARFDTAKAAAFHEAKTEADTEAREIRAAGRMATNPARVERLKARRDQACASFTAGVTMAEK
ncbi:MAG: hypothetical protein SGJ23_16285 [Alphaproteobacteria bacterium]|nr:hypothetical protein [Alphaproteobacteria bacterium]